MQQRSKDLGGECKIMSEPGKGVKVTCRFPVSIFND